MRFTALALRLLLWCSSTFGEPSVRRRAEELEQLLDLEARKEAFHSSYTQTHFITYRSGEGFNNRLQALEVTFLLAVLLNRTLVIAPFTSGHNSGKLLSYLVFLEEILTWPVIDGARHDIDLGDPVRLDQVNNTHCRVDLLDLRDEIRGSEIADVRTLRYGYVWGDWMSMFAEKYHTVIRHFLASQLRFSHYLCHGPLIPRPYAAMHLRFGDRLGLSLVNCSAFGFQLANSPAFHKPEMTRAWEDGVKFGCVRGSPEKFEILRSEDAVDAWAVEASRPPRPVYIATNRPKDPRVARVKEKLAARGIEVLSYENVSRLLDVTVRKTARDGAVLGVVEQCIALYAESFLPSWPSSWDVSVTIRRMDMSAESHVHFRLMAESLANHLAIFRNRSGCWD